MRILITGVAGFLGKHLERELIARGHEVYGCDLMHSPNPRHMRADIGNFREIEEVFLAFRPEMVYNLAGEFGRVNGAHYPEKLWATNCAGLRNIIRICIHRDIRLVHASSSESYGNLPSPQAEKDLLQKVPRFHNEYALTKWANNKQLEIGAADGLRYVNLLFFNVYGPGEFYSPYRSVVCLFIYSLLKELPIVVYRNYRRVFAYVDDWAQAVANIPERFEAVALTDINIGGDVEATVEELKDALVTKLMCSTRLIAYLEREKANVVAKRPILTRAFAGLGYSPKIGLSEGLDRTIAWMKETYK